MHVFNCCHRSGRYNWRHDIVLRQIVQYIIPAVLKARSIRTAEDRETRTGIAFKNEKRKKYKNIACLGDKTQNRIQSSEDCKVVWDEDKIPAIFAPEIDPHIKKTRHHYRRSISCGHRTDSTSRREYGASQPEKEVQIRRLHQWSPKGRLGDEILSCWSRIQRTNETLRACLKFLRLTNKEVKKVLDNIIKSSYLHSGASKN